MYNYLKKIKIFFEIAWNKIPTKTLKNVIKGESNHFWKKEHKKVSISTTKQCYNDAFI